MLYNLAGKDPARYRVVLIQVGAMPSHKYAREGCIDHGVALGERGKGGCVLMVLVPVNLTLAMWAFNGIVNRIAGEQLMT